MTSTGLSQRSSSTHPRRRTLYARTFKRALDVIGGAVLLTICALPIGVLWLIVRRDGGGGFYAHNRIGQGGRVFRCWKLRSMDSRADALLEQHLAADPTARAQWDAQHKLDNDPRVTRLGAILRKYSLDELPQFWNVVRGDMSLVGPRPVPETELNRYGPAGRQIYCSVRPGVTGLWQVSGRNAVSYEYRVALDMDYCATISLQKDVMILLKTIYVVLRPTGL